MTDEGFALPPEGAGSSNRSFWLALAGGWAAYLVINISLVGAFEDVPTRQIVWIGVVNAVPPALVSVVVAMNRRRLLRPEWSVLRTLGVHLVVGVLFALATFGLALLLMPLGGAAEAIGGEQGGARFVGVIVGALFLYVILVGFLMWWESIRRVQESHRLAAREAVLRAEAEARAIRAQFNPHFVFNTLHSLMLLVRADPAMAERAIEDVATLIRYASIIQRRDIDAVPLAKELEVSRRYVALEQLRLEDRLRVSWSIRIDSDAAMIPAFALQTLVENAIKHGIEPEVTGGAIAVDVHGEDGALVVSVRDDGPGADPADVETAGGRGIELLRGRLETLYGGRGRLDWTTEPGRGFEVTIRMPLVPAISTAAFDVIDERPGAGQVTGSGGAARG